MREQEDNLDENIGLTIDYVADFLSMRGAKPLVVVASPTGDEGSTATVMLARAISELGRSVVLVDMTATGCPTRLMSSEDGLPGIMDLLVGEAAFGETIHHDRLSNAHIVPQGGAQPQQATRVLERLTMVLGALSGTYDTVLLEFGAADASSIARIMKHLDAEIVLSMPDSEGQVLNDALAELEDEGYAQVIPMMTRTKARSDT